jgi:glycogen operon protein
MLSQIDWPYRYNATMAAPRWQQTDTAPMMPKAIVTALPRSVPHQPPVFRPGGLIYELNVKAFTKLHPDVPEEQRGTLGALAHPAIIAHLKKDWRVGRRTDAGDGVDRRAASGRASA